MAGAGETIKFQVPAFSGGSVRVTAQLGVMVDRKVGLHSFRLDEGENPPNGFVERIALINSLIDAGMPWSALAACAHAPGAIGAFIEAADNRLTECGGRGHAG